MMSKVMRKIWMTQDMGYSREPDFAHQGRYEKLLGICLRMEGRCDTVSAMCNRPIAWRRDEGADGAHVLVPVMCDEYLGALEAALDSISVDPAWPDSCGSSMVRKKLGIVSPMAHDKHDKKESPT